MKFPPQAQPQNAFNPNQGKCVITDPIELGSFQNQFEFFIKITYRLIKVARPCFTRSITWDWKVAIQLKKQIFIFGIMLEFDLISFISTKYCKKIVYAENAHNGFSSIFYD